MGPLRKHRRERQKEKAQRALAGEGLYIYQNLTAAELILPRPTRSGRRSVGPREKFMGDSLYKTMREVACLQEVEAPMPNDQLLITEIPPAVTATGTVEYVVQPSGQKPISEDKDAEKVTEDVLLNETPLEGVRILR
jgi:hypothetical protein